MLWRLGVSYLCASDLPLESRKDHSRWSGVVSGFDLSDLLSECMMLHCLTGYFSCMWASQSQGPVLTTTEYQVQLWDFPTLTNIGMYACCTVWQDVSPACKVPFPGNQCQPWQKDWLWALTSLICSCPWDHSLLLSLDINTRSPQCCVCIGPWPMPPRQIVSNTRFWMSLIFDLWCATGKLISGFKWHSHLWI